eukprot:3562649-Pyramimonas_sp.AAC.3
MVRTVESTCTGWSDCRVGRTLGWMTPGSALQTRVPSPRLIGLRAGYMPSPLDRLVRAVGASGARQCGCSPSRRSP